MSATARRLRREGVGAPPSATRRARNRVEQHCAGGLVVRAGEVLLISPRAGRWQLPKGHLEPGEEPPQAALREVREETGVQGRIVAALPSISYTYATAKGTQVHKRVDYYLMSYESGSERDSDPREVLQARWWSWEQALAALSFENERLVAEQARRHALTAEEPR